MKFIIKDKKSDLYLGSHSFADPPFYKLQERDRAVSFKTKEEAELSVDVLKGSNLDLEIEEWKR